MLDDLWVMNTSQERAAKQTNLKKSQGPPTSMVQRSFGETYVRTMTVQ
jgi:hypothetical protein